MTTYVYVAAQDDDRVSIFTMDESSGALALQSEVDIAGGPSLLALSQDKSTLYVGHRSSAQISSHRVDPATGGFTQTGMVDTQDSPTYIVQDRTGKHLLCSFYQGARVAVFPLGGDGSVGGEATSSLATDDGAHSIMTDRSNRFAYVPHIAYQQDNVLEPPKNIPGPNVIYQLRFDEATGTLSGNDPLTLEMDPLVGPRHLITHPNLDIVYFSNEQGCSVSSYRIDGDSGTLSHLQTVATLPEGVSVRNTCSQIQFTPDARLLLVPNRGHNSIAAFKVDGEGMLTPAAHVDTEAVPSAFSLDPSGRFVFAAGSATNRLAAYSVDGGSGAMTALGAYEVGARPMSVLTAELG
ncbi:MAG: beta-propeller fold lactonase family protein [Chloroflexota bacterium]|nr:beta-propeller fold lactonase family protein [Chloroflexota bacterium]